MVVLALVFQVTMIAFFLVATIIFIAPALVDAPAVVDRLCKMPLSFAVRVSAEFDTRFGWYTVIHGESSYSWPLHLDARGD